MRRRKYLGPVIGAMLSLVLAATAFAGSSSGTVTNGSPGWNTPIFNSVSFTTFKIWSCTNHNSDTNSYYDWMHHWPVIPSTGTLRVAYPCRNTTTKYSYTWTAGSTADYSVEFLYNYNTGLFSDSWSAAY
ncbi:MAG: hypothetical protein Q8N51_19870 [Gammaproteobacteria bacterium]|nr:hypothetical protein [Gammaproteobacteria bacterium]